MKRTGRMLARPLLLLLVSALLMPPVVFAQSLDMASQEALAATLRMLTDPERRGQALAGSPQGAAVDQQIQTLAGSPALAQEVYALAAQILEELTRNSGGDVSKMSQAVERGASDPAGFAAFLSPATQQRLRDLSTKISDAQGRRP